MYVRYIFGSPARKKKCDDDDDDDEVIQKTPGCERQSDDGLDA
jgi:hypothetical protein